MLARRSTRQVQLVVVLVLGFFGLAFTSSTADAQRVKAKAAATKTKGARVSAATRAKSTTQPNREVTTGLKLKTVVHEGKEYVSTFRVTSKSGLARIMDKGNSFRFFGGGGQYGEALYLFTNRKDANKFVKCNGACDIKRSVIAEVLLPKDMFRTVKKSLVLETNDWGKNPSEFNQLRLSSHVLFGRWSPAPSGHEPAFEPMNGTLQLAIRQLGNPSILHQSVIREAP